MAQFLTGSDLSDCIDSIIYKAENVLILVSPYIKLDNHFKDLFKNHISKFELYITIIFGKNENNKSKSLNKEDFEFFKQFHNVSIIYIPNLHAKYYANESCGLLTSVNLYDYSFQNNIEFGVYQERTIISEIKRSFENDIFDYSDELAFNNPVVFRKVPVFEKKFLSKKYIDSKVLYDETNSVIENKPLKNKRIMDFPEDLDKDSPILSRAEYEIAKTTGEPKTGFCIRTGIRIAFNPERPFCEQAYRSWATYKNPDYPEKYCHRTGNPSNGKTSMRKPILY